MSRLENLNNVLRKFQSDSPGVEASALISEDGLMIASALAPEMEETRIAGMTATLLNVGVRVSAELARGEVREVIVRGQYGYAVMINAGPGHLAAGARQRSQQIGSDFLRHARDDKSHQGYSLTYPSSRRIFEKDPER